MATSATSDESHMSADEVEKSAKVRQQLAEDAAKFYRENEHLQRARFYHRKNRLDTSNQCRSML